VIVGMWMTRNLVTIEPDTSVTDAAALMAHHKIRRLPVTRRVTDRVDLLGMLSATDLYRAFPADRNPFAVISLGTPPLNVTAGQIMSRHVLTTAPDTPVEDAAAVMRDKKIGALPVLRDERLIGLITESDIFRAFISMLKADSGASRITFSVSADEDVFELLVAAASRRKVRVLSLVSSRNDDKTVCVARISGPELDKVMEDLWRSGHQVLNVLR
jgi:acetoin utilization protein AcuB